MITQCFFLTKFCKKEIVVLWRWETVIYRFLLSWHLSRLFNDAVATAEF
jgi:hypothetical protein